MTPSMIVTLYDEVVLVIKAELSPTNHRLLCCLRQAEAQHLLPTIQAFAETGVLRGPGGEEPEKI